MSPGRRVALFGDAQTLPHVAGILAGMPGFRVRSLAKPGRFAGTLAFARSDIALGVMASAMPRVFARARRVGCFTVNYWIGSDVSQTRENSRLCEQLDELRDVVDLHLCVAPWLAAELSELGVQARVVPIVPPELVLRELALPERPAALAYTNPGREEFYGIPAFLDCARAHPNERFYLCGTDETPADAPSNLHVVGRMAHDRMLELYGKVSLLYRVPRHDGLSKMVLEALALGRRVLWSHELDGVRHVGSAAEARAALDEHMESRPVRNEDGLAVIEREFMPEVVRERLGLLLAR